jgi:hypothetical protein
MTNAIDRMWNIRDAVLLWLYTETAEGHSHPHISLDEIHRVAGWVAEPIETKEIAQATNYLKEQGLISGSGSFGGGVHRPSITSNGENQAATGMSVRPGPPKEVNTTGVTHNYTFNNHGPANNAVNSSDFTQTITVEQKTEKILEVADALDKHAAEGAVNADDAQQIAADLREAATDPVGNRARLQAYLGAAIGAFTFAVGNAASQQATDLAVSAIQSLG